MFPLRPALDDVRHATANAGGRAEARLSVARQDDFDFRSAEYARLFAASTATAFQHPLWLDRFYAQLAPRRGAARIVVTVRDANGVLRAVLPLILRRKSGILLLEATDLGVSDYAAPVIDRDLRATPDLSEAVADALPAHDILRIRPIRDEHVSEWQFLVAGEAVRLYFSAHAVRLAPEFAAWRAGALDGSFARMLDRKKKRFLKSEGARVRLLAEPGEIGRAIATLATRRTGRFSGDPIQQDFVRGFYASIASDGAAAALARTYAIELEGEAIGHAFGLTHNGRFDYLLIGCDYENYGRHSPGLILYDAMIEDWIANGGKVFDFTIGDEPFKQDFGTQATPMFALTHNATWRGRLASAAFATREHLRGMSRGGGEAIKEKDT